MEIKRFFYALIFMRNSSSMKDTRNEINQGEFLRNLPHSSHTLLIQQFS